MTDRPRPQFYKYINNTVLPARAHTRNNRTPKHCVCVCRSVCVVFPRPRACALTALWVLRVIVLLQKFVLPVI